MTMENDAVLKMGDLCGVCGEVDVCRCDVADDREASKDVWLKGILRGVWMLFFFPWFNTLWYSAVYMVMSLFSPGRSLIGNVEKSFHVAGAVGVGLYVWRIVYLLTRRRGEERVTVAERVRDKRLWWSFGGVILLGAYVDWSVAFYRNGNEIISPAVNSFLLAGLVGVSAVFLYFLFRKLEGLARSAGNVQLIQHTKWALWVLLGSATIQFIAGQVSYAWKIEGVDWVQYLRWGSRVIAHFCVYVIVMRYVILVKDVIDRREIERTHFKELGQEFIRAELCCVGCGYDLKGIARDGGCPECGDKAWRSLGKENMIFDAGGWIRGLVMGLWVLCFYADFHSFVYSCVLAFRPTDLDHSNAWDMHLIQRYYVLSDLIRFCAMSILMIVFSWFVTRRAGWSGIFSWFILVLPWMIIGVSFMIFYEVGFELLKSQTFDFHMHLRVWRYLLGCLLVIGVLGRYMGYVKSVGFGWLIWPGRFVVVVLGVSAFCLAGMLLFNYNLESSAINDYIYPGLGAAQNADGSVKTTTDILVMIIQGNTFPMTCGMIYLMTIGMSCAINKGAARRAYMPMGDDEGVEG